MHKKKKLWVKAQMTADLGKDIKAKRKAAEETLAIAAAGDQPLVVRLASMPLRYGLEFLAVVVSPSLQTLLLLLIADFALSSCFFFLLLVAHRWFQEMAILFKLLSHGSLLVHHP